jgi:hypothetical protein
VLDIAYDEQGDISGWPVVLLHGFPYDIHTYDEVTPRLVSEGARVITPYLRGCGPARFLAPAYLRSGQQAALGARRRRQRRSPKRFLISPTGRVDASRMRSRMRRAQLDSLIGCQESRHENARTSGRQSRKHPGSLSWREPAPVGSKTALKLDRTADGDPDSRPIFRPLMPVPFAR